MTKQELLIYIKNNHYCNERCDKCPWDKSTKKLSWANNVTICVQHLLFYIAKLFGEEKAFLMYKHILSNSGGCLPEVYNKRFVEVFNKIVSKNKMELE